MIRVDHVFGRDGIREKLLSDGVADVSEETIADFLDQLADARLVFREGDKYLSLAVAEDPRRAHLSASRPARQPAVERGRIAALQVVRGEGQGV